MRPGTVIAVLAAISTLIAGCGGSSSSAGVAPFTYMTSVCTGLGPFLDDSGVRVVSFDTAAALQTQTQRQRALREIISGLMTDTNAVVLKLRAAGSPAVSNGDAISSAVVQSFTRLGFALRLTQSQTNALPAGSPAAFDLAAKSVVVNFFTSPRGLVPSLNATRNPLFLAGSVAQAVGLNRTGKAAGRPPACRNLHPYQLLAFVTSYNSLSSQSSQTDAKITTAVRNAPSQTDAQLAATFQDLASRLEPQLAGLRTLLPPPYLVGEFAHVESAATRVESDLKAITKAATTRQGPAAGKRLFLALENDSAASRSASQALQRKVARTISQKLGTK